MEMIAVAPGAASLAMRFGWAWVGLCVAVAIHVADEALTDFLGVYNPTVRAIRNRLPWLPLPTFTFKVWLTGLVMAVAAALATSPFAFAGAGWAVLLAYPLGVLMFLNGLTHFAGSIYLRRWMPGVYSAPLLLIASVNLLMMACWMSRSRVN